MSDPTAGSVPGAVALGAGPLQIQPEAHCHHHLPASEQKGDPELSIPYRIALEIPGEHREAPATFTDFEQGLAACVAHARRHRGVRVRLFVRVSDSPIADHHDTVFEAQVPELAPFIRAGIRRQYGEEPPI